MTRSARPDRSRVGTGFLTAVGFLTRIPIPLRPVGAAGHPVAIAVPWFPVIGLAIGAVQGLVFLGLASIAPALVAASAAVAASLLVTGAFHHDGLADIADAFGGGWTPEQRMAILKDSRLGTYGTTALTLALVVEVAALGSLTAIDGFRVLVTAHGLSRAVAVGVMLVARHAPRAVTASRPGGTGDDTDVSGAIGPGADAVADDRGPEGIVGGGLGAGYIAGLRAGPAVMSIIFTMAIGLLIGPEPMATVAGLGIAATAASALVALARSKIGTINGDVLGAIQVMSMLAVVVVASVFLTGPA